MWRRRGIGAPVIVGACGALLLLIGSCEAFGTGPTATDVDGGGGPADTGAADGDPSMLDAATPVEPGIDASPEPCSSAACVPSGACINAQCPEVFATATNPVGVALTATDVYFTEQAGGLYRKPKNATDHGAATQIALVNAVAGGWGYLARNGTALAWTREADHPGIEHATIEGGVVGPVSGDPANVFGASGIALTNDGLTYVSVYSVGQVIVLDGGPAASNLFQESGAKVEGLATDGVALYAAVESQGRILRLTPGSQSIAVGGVPAGLAVDGTNLYATDQDGGGVLQVPRGGGQRVDIARVPTKVPLGIAVDNTHVYWAAGDVILRIHK